MDGRIILKWIFENWDEAWTGSNWLRIGKCGKLKVCYNLKTSEFHINFFSPKKSGYPR
jgi:hypothetical protein